MPRPVLAQSLIRRPFFLSAVSELYSESPLIPPSLVPSFSAVYCEYLHTFLLYNPYGNLLCNVLK